MPQQKDTGDVVARIIELETKITFLEDYVAKQNETIVEQMEKIANLQKAIRMLAEKTDALGDSNSAPANEKPPHW
ncbi:MAG: SlyX family protein [Opitutae bacterium]|nr:SlyX family protein [Opitutae bacterium]